MSIGLYNYVFNRKNRNETPLMGEMIDRGLKAIAKAKLFEKVAIRALPKNYKTFAMLKESKGESIEQNPFYKLSESIKALERSSYLVQRGILIFKKDDDISKLETYIMVLEHEIEYLNDIFLAHKQ